MKNNIKTTWRKVKLGEIVNVSGGGTPSTSNPKYWGGNIPWLTPAEVVGLNGNRFIDKTERYITEEGLKNSSAKVMPANSLLLTSRATIGEVVINKVPMATNQGFINIEPKEVDLIFLFYWLKNNRKFLNQMAIGSTFNELSKSVFKKIDILIPEDINEQKRIAEILSAFDEKIEANNKIIKTLEEMAQEVFKGWFIKFNFPVEFEVKNEKLKVKNLGYKDAGGKFVDSELGKIPEGWEIKNIMEIIKRLPVGKRYDNKTALPIGKVPILDQGQSGIIGFHNEEPSVKANPQNPVAVFSNHTCYYRLVTFDFSCIQNVIPYIGTNGYPTTFVFYLTKDKIKMSDYKGHWPEFANQKFVIPPQKLAIEYSEKIQPIIEKVYEIRKENQKLAELRDLLLPKLMSGEILVNS
jgi:type I restriction enzyme S subunit